MKHIFLLGTSAMITEKLPFPNFQFLYQNNAAYQSELSLKKWSQTDKDF